MTARTDQQDNVTDTERAVHGTESLAELREFLTAYTLDRLDSPVEHVRFRAGRIDAYAASSTSGGGLSTPTDAAAFLGDYDAARGARLTGDEQRVAAGAAAWIIAFNARWELGLSGNDGVDGPTMTLLRERQDGYLDLAW